jgi:hypothetical protein
MPVRLIAQIQELLYARRMLSTAPIVITSFRE